MDTESVRKYRRQSKEGSPPLRNKAFKRTLFRNRFLIRIGAMSKFMIRILKVLAFVFNVFLAIGGMTMVIVAGYAMKYLLSSDWITGKEETPTIILLTIGIFLIIASAFGVIACFRESPTILIIFIVFLIGATIAEIVVGLMAGKALKDYREYSLSELRSATKVYIGSDRHSKKIDQLQFDYQCCGIEEPSSWSSTFKYPQFPKSCCKNYVDQIVCQISKDGSNIHQEGCWMKLIKHVENHERNVMAIAMIVAIIQILAIIINVCLTFGILRQRQWKTVIVSAFKEGNEPVPKEEDRPKSVPRTPGLEPVPKKVNPNEENPGILNNIFSKKTEDQIESKINLIPPTPNKKKEENSPKKVSPEIKQYPQTPINPKSKTDMKRDSKQYPHTPIDPKSKTDIRRDSKQQPHTPIDPKSKTDIRRDSKQYPHTPIDPKSKIDRRDSKQPHTPIDPKSKTDIRRDSKQHPHTPINPKSKTDIFKSDPITKSPEKQKDKRKNSK